MRLSDQQVAAIKDAARETFGVDAVVRLFGSRADNDRRGGDIDLHIETVAERADVNHEVRFRALLWKALDEEQIDVVVHARGAESGWIDRAAFREGVVL